MKKILLTFILALSAFFVEAQFGNTFIAPGTNVGTRQTNDGGYWPKLLFQPPTFGDTTAANNGKTNFYAGSVIFTTADGNFWYRTANATRWVLFTPQFNVCAGLISGGIVTLNTGLIMNVTAATYCINNTTYNSPATTLTLATADPSLPRIDRIVGDVSGNAVVITGTPAVNPVAPFVNPVTQVAFSSVLIPAGATTPANINRYIIYNENAPPDWTGSSNLLAGAVDFASDTLPYIGVIDADVDSGTVGEIIFTSTDTLDLQNENVLQQFIRLKSAYPATSSISVAFKLGSTVVSNYVTLNPSNGFTKAIVGSYQNISIPFSQLIFTGGTLVNGYVIKLTGPSSGFYLDYIQLQNSVIPNQDDQFVAKYRRDTITAPKTLTDSLLLKTITLATNTSIPQSPVLSIESPTFDTTSGISRIAKWRIKAQGTRGSSTVNSLFTIGTPTLNVISAQQDGVVSFWNGASMFKTGSTPSIGGNGLVFSSSLASAPFAFRGNTGATLTGNFFDVASGSSYVLSNTANAFNFTGDAGQVLLRAKPSGPVSIGTTTNDYLTLDVGRIGTGMRGPSMNTLQRDGMNKNVATVTVTNPGSGYTLGIPTFSVTSPSGGLDAKFLATVTAGSVSALTILFPGNGYPSGGSLTVNNTGTGGSGAAATYTVSTGTIPTGAMIYNTDSLCYQSYNGSSWVNMREGSGGTGGSQDLASVLGFGNTANNFVQIDSLKLYDSPNGTYGSISLYDNQYTFKDANTNNIAVLDNQVAALAVYKPNGIAWKISDEGDSLTVSRNYQVPNRSGVLALTSDISPDTVVYQIYPLQSAVVGATIEQSISQGFLDSVRNGGTEYTYTIDLRTEDYEMEGPGVYIVTNGSVGGTNIQFPDPTLFEGRWITIMNNDIPDNNTATFQTNKPKINGSASMWNECLFEEMMRFVSIGGAWRGGKLSP
jgi:hypothetical protein